MGRTNVLKKEKFSPEVGLRMGQEEELSAAVEMSSTHDTTVASKILITDLGLL